MVQSPFERHASWISLNITTTADSKLDEIIGERFNLLFLEGYDSIEEREHFCCSVSFAIQNKIVSLELLQQYEHLDSVTLQTRFYHNC